MTICLWNWASKGRGTNADWHGKTAAVWDPPVNLPLSPPQILLVPQEWLTGRLVSHGAVSYRHVNQHAWYALCILVRSWCRMGQPSIEVNLRADIYCKTCDIQPRQTAASNGWTRFYGTIKLYWYQTWSLLRNLSTCVSWILATVLHLITFFMCEFNFSLFVHFQCCVFFVSCCTWGKKIVISTTFLPIQLPSFLQNYGQQTGIPAATRIFSYFRSLFIDRVVHLLSKPPVSAVWTVHLHKKK